MKSRGLAVVGGVLAFLPAVLTPVANAAWIAGGTASSGARAGSLGTPALSGSTLSCADGTPGPHNGQVGLTLTWTPSVESWKTAQNVYGDTNAVPTTLVGNPSPSATGTSFTWWFNGVKNTTYYMTVATVAGGWVGTKPTAQSWKTGPNGKC